MEIKTGEINTEQQKTQESLLSLQSYIHSTEQKNLLEGYEIKGLRNTHAKINTMFHAILTHDSEEYIQMGKSKLGYCGGLTTGHPKDHGMPTLFKNGLHILNAKEMKEREIYDNNLNLTDQEKTDMTEALQESHRVVKSIPDIRFSRPSRLFNNESLRFHRSRKAFSEADQARLDLVELKIWASLEKTNPDLYQRAKKISALNYGQTSHLQLRDDFEHWYLEQEFRQPQEMMYFIKKYADTLRGYIDWRIVTVQDLTKMSSRA